MQNLEGLITCPVCWEEYSENNKPMRLQPCGQHCVCQSCLQKFPIHGIFDCPLDRRNIDFRLVGIDIMAWELIRNILNLQARTLTLNEQHAQQPEPEPEPVNRNQPENEPQVVDAAPLNETRTRLLQNHPNIINELKEIIGLETALISHYQEVVTQAKINKTYNLISAIARSIATGLCFFPPALLPAIIANGVLTIVDIGYSVYDSTKKGKGYAKVREVIYRHDNLAKASSIRNFFLDYFRERKLNSDPIEHQAYSDQDEAYTNQVNCSKGFNVVVQGANAGNLASKLSKEISLVKGVTGKVAIAGLVVSWGCILYQMKQETDQVAFLQKRIDETREGMETIQNAVNFLQS